MTQFDIITAVEKLNYRVTTGDVSAQSGLDLNSVQRDLLNLATRSSANMQVSETGEIVYVFSPQLRQVLRDREFKLQVRAWLSKLWKWIFYLIRISFGILLVVSIAIVVIAIVVAFIALQSRNSDDSNNNSSSDRQDGGGFMPSFLWLDFGNVFAPSYYDRSPSRSLQSSVPTGSEEPPKMGFLESIFSFLFGDGNPNSDLETRRNRAISDVIRTNNGVVIAEQITPYLDDLDDVAAISDEDYMIPVLSRFNGLPQVTEIGTLAYTFPELQKVAASRTPILTNSSKKSDGYLQEDLWQFSKAGTAKITLAIALGIFYLGASLILGNLYTQLGNVTGFLGLVAGAFPLLLGYAVLFLTIPMVRYFVLQVWNTKIKAKNLKRANRAATLTQLPADIRQKLDLAREFAISEEVIGDDNLAYTTETDLNDQEYAKMLKQTPD